MDDLERTGAAMERIAAVMESMLFWVKVVVISLLAYFVLSTLGVVVMMAVLQLRP